MIYCLFSQIMHCKLTLSMLFELAEMMDMKIKALIMPHCSPKLAAVLLTSNGLIKCYVKNYCLLFVHNDSVLCLSLLSCFLTTAINKQCALCKLMKAINVFQLPKEVHSIPLALEMMNQVSAFSFPFSLDYFFLYSLDHTTVASKTKQTVHSVSV